MESLLIAFIFIMLIAGIATRKTTSSEPDRTYRPETVEKEEKLYGYTTTGYLLTISEKRFYQELKKQCIEKNLIINCKTRLEDIVQSLPGEEYASRRGKIRARHIDFVVLNSEMKVLFCIELDDSSHNSKKARENDEFKDLLLKSVGIKLYRIRNNTSYYYAINQILSNY